VVVGVGSGVLQHETDEGEVRKFIRREKARGHGSPRRGGDVAVDQNPVAAVALRSSIGDKRPEGGGGRWCSHELLA
jgi:hypothetical protein